MSKPQFNCKIQALLSKLDFECTRCHKKFGVEDVADGIQECGKEENCEVIQYSDQMHCRRCDLTWDMNDPKPPVCRYRPYERIGSTEKDY